MRTSVVINDNEQRRVKQTLSLNNLQRAAQPVEMITVNKWSSVGKALKIAGKAAMKGRFKGAARMAGAAGKEALKSKGTAVAGAAAGGYGASKVLSRRKKT